MTRRSLIRKVRDRALAFSARLPPGRRFCCVCRAPVRRFLPYRSGSASLPRLMQALDVVGSDVDNFGCPRCGAHDRERHLYLYLERTGLLGQMRGSRILHFAPERHLSRLIRDLGPADYVKADLYPTDAETQKVDITVIPFENDHFDFVIANHVMEHVTRDLDALREIFRVLRPGGHALLQTPYSAALTRTFEDTGIASEAARLQAYGQEDHVRLYGRDIFERFASAGLRRRTLDHSEVLADLDALRYGVNAREPLFLFEKAQPAPGSAG